MVHIVKAHVFNSKANQVRNLHVFHMSKAILGVTLRDEDIDPDKKFAFVKELEKVLVDCDIDCESFNKLLYDKLMLIRREFEGSVKIMSTVDGLVKHYKLWSPQ